MQPNVISNPFPFFEVGFMDKMKGKRGIFYDQ